MEKHRFMSPAWIEMARQQITAALAGADLGGVDFTLCEEFTAPPEDLRSEQDAMAARVAAGRLSVVGDPATVPPLLAQLDLHRLLASRTS